MSKRHTIIILVGLLSLMLVLSACNAPAAPETESTPIPEVKPTPVTVGLVTAVGGIDEVFYTALAWKGVREAQNLVPIEASYKESASEEDFTKNLEAFASENTDLIIAIGDEMADAVTDTAKSHPDAHFAIVDAESTASNVRGILFDVIAPSYLAGYLAGGMSQTHVVCTYGEVNEKAITNYMTGFFNGADYYRRQNGVDLEILGWDVNSKEGVFLGDGATEEEGYQTAKDFFAKDCDVIFAVAEDAAKGSARAAQEENRMFIGATVDWYVAFPAYGNVTLTSVMKKTDKAVFDTILSSVAGSFEGGSNYLGSLANNAVDLAPYHQFNEKVPQGLQAEINQVRDNILTGHLRPAEPWIYDQNNPPTTEEGKTE